MRLFEFQNKVHVLDEGKTYTLAGKITEAKDSNFRPNDPLTYTDFEEYSCVCSNSRTRSTSSTVKPAPSGAVILKVT